jgi:hypothetical protein
VLGDGISRNGYRERMLQVRAGCFYSFVNYSLTTSVCKQSGLRSAPSPGAYGKPSFSCGELGRVGGTLSRIIA